MKKKSLSGGGGETLFEGLPIQGAAQWSRDTAVACCCCCDGADVASTELMLRVARVPPRGAAASLLEVLPEAPGAGTRRVLGCSAAATELRRSRCCDGAAQTISSVALSRTRRAE